MAQHLQQKKPIIMMAILFGLLQKIYQSKIKGLFFMEKELLQKKVMKAAQQH
jgi:hypothetical protein